MNTADGAGFGTPAFFADPYPFYSQLREAGEPVFEARSGSWLVSRYQDVEAVLRDSLLSKQFQRANPTPFETSVLLRHPPDHTRVRGLLNQAFSGPAIAGLEAKVEQFAGDLILNMKEKGRADFMAEFALPLAVAVIAGLLGAPHDDTELLHRWSSAFVAEDSVPQEQSGALQYSAICEMSQYFRELISRCRSQLRDDVLSALIQAHEAGENLSEDELTGNCILLLAAGHETTVNLLGNGMYLLMNDASRFEQSRLRPETLPAMIEEMLRFEAPVRLGTFRVATEPVSMGHTHLESPPWVRHGAPSLFGRTSGADGSPCRVLPPDGAAAFSAVRRRAPHGMAGGVHKRFGIKPHGCCAADRQEPKLRHARAMRIARFTVTLVFGFRLNWKPSGRPAPLLHA